MVENRVVYMTNLTLWILFGNIDSPGTRPISTVKYSSWVGQRWKEQSVIEYFTKDLVLEVEPVYFILITVSINLAIPQPCSSLAPHLPVRNRCYSLLHTVETLGDDG